MLCALAQTKQQGAVDEFVDLDHGVALDTNEAQGLQNARAARAAVPQLHFIDGFIGLLGTTL